MLVINLYGGPGSGKSTTAAVAFAYLKNKGIRAELVGEEAKHQIYWGSSNQLRNQFLLASLQYTRLRNLKEAGCKIAISDSPLLQNIVYSRGISYHNELKRLVELVNTEFDNKNVRVIRVKPYDQFGRVQTAEEAKEIDSAMPEIPYDLIIAGDTVGQRDLCRWFDENNRFGL